MGNSVTATGGTAIGVGNRGGDVSITNNHNIYNHTSTAINGKQIAAILFGSAVIATTGVVLYRRSLEEERKQSM
jgi:hypothetical protein